GAGFGASHDWADDTGRGGDFHYSGAAPDVGPAFQGGDLAGAESPAYLNDSERGPSHGASRSRPPRRVRSIPVSCNGAVTAEPMAWLCRGWKIRVSWQNRLSRCGL